MAGEALQGDSGEYEGASGVNPTKFRLVVTFRLENEKGESKSLGVEHIWDFKMPDAMRFSELNRTLRYSLLSIIRTASWASVIGWKSDPYFQNRISSATEEEHKRVYALSRTCDPPEDFEMGAAPQ